MTTPSDELDTLPLRPELVKSVHTLGYTELTPVQIQTLPLILDGKDVLAQAKTGSGKTAAFAIGLLNSLEVDQYQTRGLVLCPTRELADQVSNEIRRLASTIANTRVLTLCGGKPMSPQLASLQRKPHIVVGTPGRILKHLAKGSLDLSKVSKLVLDEADRMLDMGFTEDMMAIIKQLPQDRQTLLFSATYPDTIGKVSNKVQRNARQIRIEDKHTPQEIEQFFVEVDEIDRGDALVSALHKYKPESTLVFCNRKIQCDELAKEVRQAGFKAIALHGDLEQFERDEVLVQFANKSCSVLIATDVAARGLDIKDLSAVINFELTPDPEIHIHRVGRTGRAGKQGLAISLFTDSEKHRVEAIESYAGSKVKKVKRSSLGSAKGERFEPPMTTLRIHGGRKDKLRAGDLVGALTRGGDLQGDQIGKIDIFDKLTYVAVPRKHAQFALSILAEDKIKGRRFKIRKLG